jgi:hypothetical protein
MGLKEASVGAGEGLTVKLAVEVADPPGVVTVRAALKAPAGTTARTWVSLSTE